MKGSWNYQSMTNLKFRKFKKCVFLNNTYILIIYLDIIVYRLLVTRVAVEVMSYAHFLMF